MPRHLKDQVGRGAEPRQAEALAIFEAGSSASGSRSPRTEQRGRLDVLENGGDGWAKAAERPSNSAYPPSASRPVATKKGQRFSFPSRQYSHRPQADPIQATPTRSPSRSPRHRPQGIHPPDGLVAENDRQAGRRHAPLDLVELRMADPETETPDPDLPRSGSRTGRSAISSGSGFSSRSEIARSTSLAWRRSPPGDLLVEQPGHQDILAKPYRLSQRDHLVQDRPALPPPAGLSRRFCQVHRNTENISLQA